MTSPKPKEHTPEAARYRPTPRDMIMLETPLRRESLA